MERRKYKIKTICINRRKINEVIIDPHVDKHSDHITDELILELVLRLEDVEHVVQDNSSSFQYYVSEISYNFNLYKMVWLLEDNKFYVGIITAFRDRRL